MATRPHVASVRPLPDRRPLITFRDGSRRIYDCNHLMERDRFRLLATDAFFKAVCVDPSGYGISWNDDMDLSEWDLWEYGPPVEQGADNDSAA